MGADVDAMVEQAAAERGLDHPRVKPSDLDELIKEERYWQPPGTTLTVCVMTLENGFSLVGTSAVASRENFDAQLGRDIARAEARDKIWELEGYLLRQRLHDEAKAVRNITGTSRKLVSSGWQRITPGLEGRVAAATASSDDPSVWIDVRPEPAAQTITVTCTQHQKPLANGLFSHQDGTPCATGG